MHNEDMLISKDHFVGEFWVIDTALRRNVVVAHRFAMPTADYSDDFQTIHAPTSFSQQVWQAFAGNEEIEEDVRSVILSTEVRQWPRGSVAYYLFIGTWTIGMDKRLREATEIIPEIQSTFNIDPARCGIAYI